MKYLVDTDIIIDALAVVRETVGLLDALSTDGLAVSIVSLGELYEGTYRSSNPGAAQDALRSFLDGYAVLNLSDPIAAGFGHLRAFLRRQGQLIPDLDLLIAATAHAHDLTLVTRNRRHFSRIPGLRLYEPIDAN